MSWEVLPLSWCTALLSSGAPYNLAYQMKETQMRNKSHWEWCKPPNPSSSKPLPAADAFQTGTQGETNKFLAIFIINKTRVNHARITTSVIWPLLPLSKKAKLFCTNYRLFLLGNENQYSNCCKILGKRFKKLPSHLYTGRAHTSFSPESGVLPGTSVKLFKWIPTLASVHF